MHDWPQLAKRYGPLVWRVAYRVLQDNDEAAECHQDVFVDAIHRSDGVEIENWPAFFNWLTVRRAFDRFRRRSRSAIPEHSDIGISPSNSTPPGSEVEWRELCDVVRYELARLPERQAEAFWLHSIEELTAAEIAAELELTPEHVRVLVHRARVHLREALPKKYPDLVPVRAVDTLKGDGPHARWRAPE